MPWNLRVLYSPKSAQTEQELQSSEEEKNNDNFSFLVEYFGFCTRVDKNEST